MTRQGAPPAPLLTRFDRIEVAIDKLVTGGDGLARYEGLPIFVSRAAPGDRVDVRIVERRPSYARAEIVAVLVAGAGRVEPRCRHFGDCGGCDLQHLDYEHQLAAKAAATVETLARLSKLELPEPRVVAGEEWAYRTRTQLHAADPAAPDPAAPGEEPRFGYHARASHRVVAVEECPVLVPGLETAVRRLPAVFAALPGGGGAPARLDLCVGDGDTLSVAPPVAGLPHGAVGTRIGAFEYAFDAACFFQGHRALLPRLVAEVVGDEMAGGAGRSLAVDLYAGVGLFALPLAARHERVIAVEGDRSAARYARINARRNKTANVEVVHLAVESWAPALPEACDRVVVDPPRAGLAAAVTAALVARPPRRLTYVSCHPAALARDLALLAPRFAVTELVLFDLFPQTGHVEAVAQLARR